jgi:hypothetical protein
MNSESHRAVHAKAPLATIVIGALGVLAAGVAALVFFSKEEAPNVAPGPVAAPAPVAASAQAPAAAVAPPAAAPVAAVAPAGSGSGSGSAAEPVPPVAAIAAPVAAPPLPKSRGSKAATGAAQPATKQVGKPAKKTSPVKTDGPVNPYD